MSMIIDDAFSTGTRLESAGIARSVHCLWKSGSSAKTRNKKDRGGGLVRFPLRCLSQFFPMEKKIILVPSVGTTIPLQIKLVSQRLMVSTRNTSRSHANPLRMQDQPDDVDSRPPEGMLETV